MIDLMAIAAIDRETEVTYIRREATGPHGPQPTAA
jgi:hypothetical protein